MTAPRALLAPVPNDTDERGTGRTGLPGDTGRVPHGRVQEPSPGSDHGVTPAVRLPWLPVSLSSAAT